MTGEYATIKEGLAYILVPKEAQTSVDPKLKNGVDSQPQSVFYNPIQQFNRDLSVLAIRAYGEDMIEARLAKAERAKAVRRNKGKKRQGNGVAAEPTKVGEKDAQHVDEKVDEMVDERIDEKVGERIDEKIDNKVDSNAGTEHTSNGQKRTSEDAELPPPDEGQSSKRPKNTLDDQGNPAEPDTIMTDDQNEAPKEPTPKEGPPPDKSKTAPPKFKILDALSATGLRALRYSKELPFVTNVTANDLSPEATKSIRANVAHNALESKITVVTGNALAHMYSLVNLPSARGPHENAHKYDVVDLDPYGSAAPFLDAAMQAVNDGGLLCVTCTDSALFASVGYCEKTYAQYGGMPIKGLHSHEGGLRLILHALATTAARYGMAIEPLLSLSVDFYARVFVRVFRSPAEVKFHAGKTMLVYSCDSGCGAWQTQFIGRYQSKQAKDGTPIYSHTMAQGPTASPLCKHCGFKTHLSGPMYGGPLHNPAFIEAILSYLPDLDKTTYATTARIEGMLSTALEETLIQGNPETATTETQAGEAEHKEDEKKSSRLVPRMDPAEQDRHPFFWFPSALAKVVHARAPSEAALKGALRHAGFRAVRSHAKPGAIRTDAPWSFVWEMMREWVRQEAPIKEDSIKPSQAGWKIMKRDQPTQAVAEAEKEAESVEQEKLDGSILRDAGTVTSTQKWEIVFDEQLGRRENNGLRKQRLVRYQVNPRANWGPMVRAKKVGKV